MRLMVAFRHRWTFRLVPILVGTLLAVTVSTAASAANAVSRTAAGSATKSPARWSIPYTFNAIADGTDLLDVEWLPANSERVVRRLASTGAVRWTSPIRAIPGDNYPSWIQLALDHTTGTIFEFEDVETATQPYTLRLSAYSESTGRQLWSLVPPGDAQGQLSVAADRGRVLISTASGNVAYDSSGHQLWSHGLWFGQIPGGSILAYGRYYSGADVLDPNTGNVLWTWNMDYVAQMTSPTVNGNLIMFGGNQVIAWYAANGCGQFSCAKLGMISVSGSYQFPPVAIGNTTLAWTASGVEAYSLTSRKLLWKETSDSDLMAYRIAGSLVWTLDSSGGIRSYQLTGCGHLTCRPTRTIANTYVSALYDLLVIGQRVIVWFPVAGRLLSIPIT